MRVYNKVHNKHETLTPELAAYLINGGTVRRYLKGATIMQECRLVRRKNASDNVQGDLVPYGEPREVVKPKSEFGRKLKSALRKAA